MINIDWVGIWDQNIVKIKTWDLKKIWNLFSKP
jgi:hypothetical protein